MQIIFTTFLAFLFFGCASSPPAQDASNTVVSLDSTSSTEQRNAAAISTASTTEPEESSPDDSESGVVAALQTSDRSVANLFGADDPSALNGSDSFGGLGVVGSIPPTGSSVPTAGPGASIDREVIRRVVRSHIGEVKKCYEEALQKKPDLEGRVVLRFTIAKSGDVTAATIQDSTLPDPSVGQCIAKSALTWKFPPHPGDGPIMISYPFVFKAA